MKRFFIGILSLLSVTLNAQKMSNQEYVEQFKGIAMQEMRDYKIPASITLAQGILESGSGNSRLAKEGNNHFGIKCKKNWTGKTIIEDDDEKNECFRAYESPFESYKDHSLFLRNNQRYAFLFDLSILDYKGWAEGLRSAGYATNQRYPQLLIGIIERLNLAQFDTLVFYGEDKNYFDKEKVQPNIMIVDNGIPLTISKPGQNARSIADENNMREWQIFKYNDIPKGSRIDPGMIIYLKPKKNKAAVPEHRVEAGESMWEISQKYGIKLKKLYRKNKMESGTEVLPGETLNMRRKSKVMPDTGRVKESIEIKNDPQSVKETTIKNSADYTSEKPKHYVTIVENNNSDAIKKTYTVLQGETLFSISRKLGVTVEQLSQWNTLKENNIKVGDTLVYYEKETISKDINNNNEKKNTVVFHTVKQGETLFGISRIYNVSVDEIKQWNNLKSNELKIGQNLKIGE